MAVYVIGGLIMLTKKDYVAIAKIVNKSYAGDSSTEFELPALEKRLADYFEQDNPKFNRQRFLDACFKD